MESDPVSGTTAELHRASATQGNAPLRFVSLMFLLVVATQKLAVPGGSNVEVPFLIVSLGLGVLAVRGHVRISGHRLATFCLAMALLIGVAVYPGRKATSTPTGLIYLILLYSPFVLHINVDATGYTRFLRNIQFGSLAVATFVYIGWLMQLVGLKPLSLESVVPDSMLFQHYVYEQPIFWGSRFLKPNGFLMLETSFTSQFLAMSAVIELVLLKRPLYFAYLIIATVVTFGGTGLLLLIAAAPIAIFYLNRRTLILLGLTLPIVLGVAYGSGVVHNVVQRSGEAQEDNSSANGRFVLPFVYTADVLSSDVTTLLVGLGPGNADGNVDTRNMVLNPFTKLLTEYGVVAGLIFFIWFSAVVVLSGAPGVIIVMVLTQFAILNGSLLVPVVIYYCLFFCSLLRVRPQESQLFSHASEKIATGPKASSVAALEHIPSLPTRDGIHRGPRV